MVMISEPGALPPPPLPSPLVHRGVSPTWFLNIFYSPSRSANALSPCGLLELTFKWVLLFLIWCLQLNSELPRCLQGAHGLTRGDRAMLDFEALILGHATLFKLKVKDFRTPGIQPPLTSLSHLSLGFYFFLPRCTASITCSHHQGQDPDSWIVPQSRPPQTCLRQRRNASDQQGLSWP